MRNHSAVASLLGVALALTACGGTAGTPGQSSAEAASSSTGVLRTSEGGMVTVAASWLGSGAGATFDVKLDTHSVDLDALDLSDAVLRNDRGDTLAAQPWTAPKGGHHREGVLAFGGDAASFFAGAKWIELGLAGVGDIPERTFRWEIGS
jgi:hypothetical protein